MKKLLIIAHNNVTKEFWGKYLDPDQFNITIFRNAHPESLRKLNLKYDITIVDTYFCNKFLSSLKVIQLARLYLSLKNLGERYVLTSILPKVKVLGVKYSRFDEDFIKYIKRHHGLTISA
jgi:hypothetical protein